MSLIDADAWIEQHCEGCKYKENGICSKEDPVCGSVELMNEAPTIDAIPVVRCKDCTSWKKSSMDCGWCEAWEGMRYHNHFCNYGERRSNG
jgi:hypothetical protein